MIGFLSGKVLKKLDRTIILSNESIGYEVGLVTSLFDQLEEGQKLELFIHTNVRESEISLYGFQTAEELKLFRKMISISGIGPRLGMDFLAIPQEKLKAAIVQGDSAFLTAIPGVGKKTAERLILELKEKIDIGDANIDLSRSHQNISNDVYAALKSLGYQHHHIKTTLKDMPENMTDTEEIIKFFLQNI